MKKIALLLALIGGLQYQYYRGVLYEKHPNGTIYVYRPSLIFPGTWDFYYSYVGY